MKNVTTGFSLEIQLISTRSTKCSFQIIAFLPNLFGQILAAKAQLFGRLLSTTLGGDSFEDNLSILGGSEQARGFG